MCIRNLAPVTWAPVKPRSACDQENERRVFTSINADRTATTRLLSEELGMSQTSVCRIMKRNSSSFTLFYYQELIDGDDDRRSQFCEILNNRFTNDPAFFRKPTFRTNVRFEWGMDEWGCE